MYRTMRAFVMHETALAAATGYNTDAAGFMGMLRHYGIDPARGEHSYAAKLGLPVAHSFDFHDVMVAPSMRRRGIQSAFLAIFTTLALESGGTAMYALLALAGDLGCSSGPTTVGMVANAAGGDLKAGLLVALVFPIMMLIGLMLLKDEKKAK